MNACYVSRGLVLKFFLRDLFTVFTFLVFYFAMANLSQAFVHSPGGNGLSPGLSVILLSLLFAESCIGMISEESRNIISHDGAVTTPEMDQPYRLAQGNHKLKKKVIEKIV